MSLWTNAPRSSTPGSRIDSTTAWVAAGLVLLLGVMFGRVVQLQVAPPEQLEAHRGERTSVVSEPGRRGDVLDRRGRVLAASRFGKRVFVDPTKFRSPPDADIMQLADALRLPVEQVGPPILSAMVHNAKVVELTARGEDAPAARRYVPIGDVLTDGQEDVVRKLGIPGVHLETRAVREVVAEDASAALLGKVGTEQKGLMGAELMLDAKVQPTPGKLEFVRDARGQALWVAPGGYTPPQRGQDVRLAIDLELQRMAVEELERGVVEADAQGGRIVSMDPLTGEIVAMADIVRPTPDAVEYNWTTLIARDKQYGGGAAGPRYRTIALDPRRAIHPALGRNRCIEDIYEPGSTFKPFMWSAATELGVVSPSEVFNTHGGQWVTPYGRGISDVTRRDSQTWTDVLINSSNIGMVQGLSRLTFAQMHDAVTKFGFGKITGIGLPGEASGLVTPLKRWSNYSQTSVAMGHEVAVTPVQMVRAFSVFARPGELSGTMAPVRMLAASDETPEVRVTRRILPVEIADLTRETMRGVTHNLDKVLAQRTPPEDNWRYELFGKSGTAEIPMTTPPPGKHRPKGSDGYFRGQYNASFIAGGPVEAPRLVTVVVIDDPGPELVKVRKHRGTGVAGPVVRRYMDRALAYLGVPASQSPAGGVAHVAAE